MPANRDSWVFALTLLAGAAVLVSIAGAETLLAMACLAWLVERPRPIVWPSYFVPLCAFMAATTLALMMSPQPDIGAGAIRKFVLFSSAVDAGATQGLGWLAWLAVLGVLNSAISLYYYLRLIVYMYMREPEAAPPPSATSFAGGLALAVALAGVIVLGVMPAPFIDLAQAAVTPLLR